MDNTPPGDDCPVHWLGEGTAFPPPELARGDGLLAVGGDLSAPRLLEAYRNGIFPWFDAGEDVLWWSPDPRLILDPADLRVSRSLRAVVRRGTYATTLDTAFRRVIRDCARTPRKEGPGTWITPEVEAGYAALHDLGYAHSVETWCGGDLVGGLYGVLLGRCFFGESMFSRRTGASKVALVRLADVLLGRGVRLIDCQVASPHLIGLGATTVPREAFLRRLAGALTFPDAIGRWTESHDPPLTP
ncbi:MAG: leucyl/phenylalanyl-tRNA--protein transferase [Planctomycetia bacterium]|nr:leucyl/phenylalanyl-tRNA--protein transferase [Planctomycetia bacterium]